MALSDNEFSKNLPSPKRRSVDASRKHWSDSQKIEAVTTYLALGDLRLTANVLKIPEITMRVWKAKDWWKEIEGELRLQEDLQLSTRLQKIINKSFEQVEDRLLNGDYIYDQKTGELVRKPVNMKDAHKVAVDLIDKRQVLLNRNPQQITSEGVDDKLLKLAEKFAQIAGTIKAPVQVTDVIYEDTSKGIYEKDDNEVVDIGGESDNGRGLGADTLGAGDDNDPDGVFEGGDPEGEEDATGSREETNG